MTYHSQLARGLDIEKIIFGIEALIVALLSFNFLCYNFFQMEIDRNLLRYIAAVLFVICIILKRNITFVNIILLFVSVLITLVQGNLALSIAFLILTSIVVEMENDDLKNKVRHINMALVLIVIISLALNLVDNELYSIGDRARYTLGFNNVNSGAMFFYSSMLTFLYTKKNINFWHILFSLIGSYVVYSYTDSRTAFIGLIIFVGLYWIINKHLNTFCRVAIYAIEIAVFIFPFLIGILNTSFPELDVILSRRFTIFLNYTYSNSLFNLLFGGSTASEIDNIYLLLLYNIGIFLYILFFILVVRATHFLILQKKSKEIAYVVSILLTGLMESAGVRCEFISTMIFWNIIVYYSITMHHKAKQQEPLLSSLETSNIVS